MDKPLQIRALITTVSRPNTAYPYSIGCNEEVAPTVKNVLQVSSDYTVGISELLKDSVLVTKEEFDCLNEVGIFSFVFRSD